MSAPDEQRHALRGGGGRVSRRSAIYVLAIVFTLTACTSAEYSSATPGASAGAASASVGTSSPAASPVRPIAHAPLPAGTYTSEAFATPLTFTVPDGWKMFEDEPGQFGLALMANDGPCLCVWRDVSVAASSCAEEPEPGVGRSSAEIVAWLADHEGLDASEPEPTLVGGLEGYVIDVAIDAAWAGTCPFSGDQPIVMTLVGSGVSAGVHWGSDVHSSQRYYVLDLSEDAEAGNIAITVEVCCGAAWEERMAAVTPVIESFRFGTGG